MALVKLLLQCYRPGLTRLALDGSRNKLVEALERVFS